MPTVYLDGHDVEARLVGRRIEIARLDMERDRVRTVFAPLHDIDRVVVIGRPYVTMAVITRLLQEDIPVSFVSSGGRWLGLVQPGRNGNALRRLRQYELARDEGFALGVAQEVVATKLLNYRRVLQRLSANREESALQEQVGVSNTLQVLARRTAATKTLDELRGIEGTGTGTYFGRLRAFFPAAVPFRGRSRRPPRDGANALLSWTYTVLQGEVETAVLAAGLDPCLGYLHGISYGRPSLALDLLEPLRGPVADLLVLQLLNHGVIQAEDFTVREEDGGVYLGEVAKKRWFCEYERAMERLFRPRRGMSHTSFRRAIREQVLGLIRVQSGGEDSGLFRMP